MPRLHRAVRVAGLSLIVASLPVAAHAADLVLRRVMLSTGGVGYFEYDAEVDGPAELGLDVPLDQVDDVLMSLVVFDSTGGVGGVQLPGRDGLRGAFAELPFSPDALRTPIDTLNGLQGSEIEVTGPRPMHGRIVRAEATREAAPGASRPTETVQRTRVTLLTDDGLRQFLLEDADSVQIADPRLRGRLAAALDALRGQARADRRHITLVSTGQGHRTVRVGYVAAAPLWKTTYRLVLPQATGQTARIQGWAVLENATGRDWSNVELTLEYGNPVTFRQALYRTYFVQRPEVPVEILGRILPDADTRARAIAPQAFAAPPPPPAPAPAPALAARAAAPATPDAMATIASPSEEAAATEGAEQTIFRLPHPVSLAADQTASVPILDREVPAGRVGFVPYGRHHPLAAIRLTNDSGGSLPAGVLTLLDPAALATFAGDARLSGLPNGERRLLSFAEDLRTTVDTKTDDQSLIVGLTMASGVARVQVRNRTLISITLNAPAQEPRGLLLELPRDAGQTLGFDGPAITGVEETDSAWRVPLTLRAGEVRTLKVFIDRVEASDVSIRDDEEAAVRLLGERGLSTVQRAALQRVVDLRQAVAARRAERERLGRLMDAVAQDEDRIRRNLAAVPAGDALQGRLVRQLDADEQRIAQLRQEIAQADTAVDQATKAVNDAIAQQRL